MHRCMVCRGMGMYSSASMGAEGQAVDGEGGAIRMSCTLYTHSSRTRTTRQPTMYVCTRMLYVERTVLCTTALCNNSYSAAVVISKWTTVRIQIYI